MAVYYDNGFECDFVNPYNGEKELYWVEISGGDLATIIRVYAHFKGVNLDGTDGDVINLLYDIIGEDEDEFIFDNFIERAWEFLTKDTESIPDDIQSIIDDMEKQYLDYLEDDVEADENIVYRTGWENAVDEYCINGLGNENNVTYQNIEEILAALSLPITRQNEELYRNGREQGIEDIRDLFDGRDYFEPEDIEDYEDWQQDILKQYLD